MSKAIELPSRKAPSDRLVPMSLKSNSNDLGKTASGAYQNTMLLYTMHFFFAFTARMWDMGIVLLLSTLSNNNLTLVAFAGFLTNLYVVLFMGGIGHFLDNTNRLSAAQYALSAKLITVAVAYSICAYIFYNRHEGNDPARDDNAKLYEYLLYTIPFISASANLCFSTVSTSVEKDWIVVLADGDSRWLSNTNSRMTQIDSGCNAFAPALTGLLFVQFSPSVVAMILLLSNLFSTVFLYVFMHSLYDSWESLAVRQIAPTPSTNQSSRTATANQSNARASETTSLLGKESYKQIPEGVMKGVEESTTTNYGFLTDFMNSGCAGTMIAYAFLYFTVLNFGSLMVVYLRWCNVSDAWIGAARGAGAFTGLLGATAFPYISNSIGIYRASNLSIIFQFLLVLIACGSFFFIQNGFGQYAVQVLCISVVSLTSFELYLHSINLLVLE